MAQREKEDKSTGRTIIDLIVDLAGSRYLWVVVACVIAAFFVSWGIIHYIAEPGSPVSVWGAFQYTKKKSVTPKAITLPPLPPEHSPLSRDEITELTKDLAHRIVSLRKLDNSIQVLVDDPSWKSQAWTTAQALVGVLSSTQGIIGSYRDQIWAAVHFIENAKNTSGGGWQDYRGAGPSVLVPTAWVTMAYARLVAYPGIWSSEERTWARIAGEQAMAELLRYRDLQTGGFYDSYPPSSTDRARYSYNSVLALLTLLDGRSAGLVPPGSLDEPISRDIAWLSRQQRVESGRCRFKEDGRSGQAEESLGLSLMILYSFELARRAGIPVEMGQCERALLLELKEGLQATILDAKRHDSIYVGTHIRNIRMMWYPWALLWIGAKLSGPDSAVRSEVEELRNRLLDRRMVQILVNTFGSDATWRIAETLMAVGTAASRL